MVFSRADKPAYRPADGDKAMRLISQTKPTRQAFTLVELVVVIAIILVLAALLLSAVFKAMTFADELKNTNDIRQIDLAVQTFKTRYNVDYIPSKIFLSNARADYPTSTPATLPDLKYDSLQYLQRLWPRLDWTKPISWSPSSAPAGMPATLEGNQCLVFFLGGIPSIDTATGIFKCNGFSTDSTNPTNLSPTVGIVSPFYTFAAERLHLAGGPNAAGTTFDTAHSVFFDYLDSYGTRPYAYFSCYKTANGYGRYGSSDCLLLGGSSFLPYGAAGVFQNPNSHQIISAGRDKAFGTSGSSWIPGTASDTYPPGNPGADDQANFYNRTLGIPTP
jgi:prepilin-type N-terminal cleavage/methylation domain-containing protein